MTRARARLGLRVARAVGLASLALVVTACSLAFPVDDYGHATDAGATDDAGSDAPADADAARD